MKKRHIVNNSLVVLLLIASPTLRAEIYSYLDANGVRVYTNNPPNRPNIKMHSTDQTTNNPKIYKFVDSKGIIHFTDKPKNSHYKLILQGGIKVPSFLTSIDSPTPKKHKFKYKTLIQEVATGIGLEPALLHAIIQIESAYNPKAVSPKGAVGLMQLMPETAERFGVKDRTDATANVYGGARYLRHLLKLFNNNIELALAAYNAGENAVKRYDNQIPPYRETKNYVSKVMSLYRAYQTSM
ncbi:Transglycosylase SLT domain protein [Candidatus Thiomargarita nelsonii]|uniref:Transglycosylase SLT domain protein n=1 Tax=Candidatus Thiomargarita nelsonii TaxID=1003181 RepID=A0A176RU29_9GAMM|nr:Transglycosylase SLT domain protein [Candidatus Thiomargarita nelsonii]